MADYSTLKVPDLKKLLGERGLIISGNKADLIARLQEDDGKKNGSAAVTSTGAGEDEIDWDEDDNKVASEPTSAPAAAAVAASGVGQVANPVAVPNQKAAIDPSTTSDLTVKQPEPTPATTDAAPAAAAEGAKPEELKKDYTAGVALSEAQKEAEKRAARAKRFAKPTPAGEEKKEPEQTLTEEEKKLAERAKKFGTGDKKKKNEEEIVESIVNTLNGGLPERKLKRGREERGEGAGRQAKRQTPDRRTEGSRGGRGGRGGGGRGAREGGAGAPAAKKITDDPTEAAKAEARKKRFATKTD